VKFRLEPKRGNNRLLVRRRWMAGAIPVCGNGPFTMMGESVIYTRTPTGTAALGCAARAPSLVFA
jgi:hypothetical protein